MHIITSRVQNCTTEVNRRSFTGVNRNHSCSKRWSLVFTGVRDLLPTEFRGKTQFHSLRTFFKASKWPWKNHCHAQINAVSFTEIYGHHTGENTWKLVLFWEEEFAPVLTILAWLAPFELVALPLTGWENKGRTQQESIFAISRALRLWKPTEALLRVQS